MLLIPRAGEAIIAVSTSRQNVHEQRGLLRFSVHQGLACFLHPNCLPLTRRLQSEASSKPNDREEMRMSELESRQNPNSSESLPLSQGQPSADQCERPTADWRAYTPETLHALDD
jgi:hypothetical protein